MAINLIYEKNVKIKIKLAPYVSSKLWIPVSVWDTENARHLGEESVRNLLQFVNLSVAWLDMGDRIGLCPRLFSYINLPKTQKISFGHFSTPNIRVLDRFHSANAQPFMSDKVSVPPSSKYVPIATKKNSPALLQAWVSQLIKPMSLKLIESNHDNWRDKTI